jgi:hypothetical protein
VDWDRTLLVVEDRDELESRARFFVVLARRGHAYVVGVLNEPFDSRNAESELAECESSVAAMTRRTSCGWRSPLAGFRPHVRTTRVSATHRAPTLGPSMSSAKNPTILALTSTFDRDQTWSVRSRAPRAEGRCLSTGPDLRFSMVAGAGFEPATFGL